MTEKERKSKEMTSLFLAPYRFPPQARPGSGMARALICTPGLSTPCSAGISCPTQPPGLPLKGSLSWPTARLSGLQGRCASVRQNVLGFLLLFPANSPPLYANEDLQDLARAWIKWWWEFWRVLGLNVSHILWRLRFLTLTVGSSPSCLPS